MKTNGLSSTSRTLIRKANRHSELASLQERFLAAKEKQKSLRRQAEQAFAENQKREKAKARKSVEDAAEKQ